MKTLLDHAVEGLGEIAVYESQSLDRHLDALRVRVSVASKARGLGELIRDQIDLIPATQALLMDDYRERRVLWRQLRERIATAVQ